MNNVASSARTIAYAWGSEPNSATYTPNSGFSYNSSGQGITATRSAAGVYQMQFAGLDLGSGHVKVTSTTTTNRCNASYWSGDAVNVNCYDVGGALADAAYMVLVTR